MVLTIEYQNEAEELDIVCDLSGLELFISHLQKLKRDGGHIHLMTPSWAGDELTEEKQSENGVLINHLRVVLLTK
jgi:hypothetical protein